MALTADTALLTAWANDVGYSDIFARQVHTFGQSGDVLLVISTSGRSQNLVNACKAAKTRNVGCLALLGGDGGDVLPLVDLALRIPAADGQRVQEVQLFILHLICEQIEADLMPKQSPTPARLPPATEATQATLAQQPVSVYRSP
ncbi:MAG: SIS domain-containing protein [Leptolyngbyaceae cyanobacterium SM1_1_3]|nr:SIS domain-containing protein [Leptolyngbyaceae cyanobacterium SM1_1_3]NJN04966.1 SIS domain-containing protein [Leptolyngbyaceae cyanobacterium RM1_1_2]NJO10159.1 SIS domain-containing protein [Leptolyngbyaceae cyanobacterium SL_1_1]